MKTKRVPLVVTQAHVDDAECRTTHCVVATAVRDAYGIEECAVGLESTTKMQYCLIYHPSKEATLVPEPLNSEIARFDRLEGFRTGVYFIDLPEELCSK